MKIMLFTPTVATSAIGSSSLEVITELIKLDHVVTVVRSESTEDTEATLQHNYPCLVVHWSQKAQVVALASDCDVIVYQMGNNYKYHHGCIEWLPSLPGIIILHDYFLGNCFVEWFHQQSIEKAKAILNAWYRTDVAQAYLTYMNSPDFIKLTHKKSPMTEWIASQAIGVLTHSRWDIGRILQSCGGPVDVAPLGYDSQKIECILPDKNLNDDFIILTIGCINPNKRADSVIQAISHSTNILKKHARYRLVGDISPTYACELKHLANRCQVQLDIIDGYVDDATLKKEIQHADVMCCLRNPIVESASASTIEAMLYGKATIVINHGFYKDLLDNYVIKISLQDEISQLQEQLELLYINPEERFALGQRAREYAVSVFSITNYTASLVNVCERAIAILPMIKTVRYFSQLLERWGWRNDQYKNDVIIKDIINSLKIFEP